ncbi:hypothetical protein ACJJTC_014583, partial [Scirpophaga incertulas]
NLYNFLAQPNVLTHLNLTNTETTLENMWGALLRGCAARLSALLVGRNPWSAVRRPKDPPPSFRQFFTACLALTDLDFSYCKMPPDALKSLLLGLACNESATGVQLNLSGVLSSSQAAHVLESCVHGVRCLQSLDLSDNSMEFELSGIVRAIGKNHSITHLSLSKLTGKRSYAPPLIQALVHVLQEPDTALTSLDLSDCKLKGDLYGLLNALGGARRLRSLDCNCTLHTLYIDRNAFSLQGLTDIATALRRSVSVRRVEFPGCDAAAGGRAASERVATLWRELHERYKCNINAHALGLTDIATALRRSVSVRRVEFPGCDAAAGGRAASERVATLWRELHERYKCNINVHALGLTDIATALRRSRVATLWRELHERYKCNINAHALGLTDIATALRRSVSVRRVEFPGCDAAAGGRAASERVATLWRELHERYKCNINVHALGLTDIATALRRSVSVRRGGVPGLRRGRRRPRGQRARRHALERVARKRCGEVFAAMGGAGSSGELVTLQAVRDAMAPCSSTLQDLLNEAVESLALAACEVSTVATVNLSLAWIQIYPIFSHRSLIQGQRHWDAGGASAAGAAGGACGPSRSRSSSAAATKCCRCRRCTPRRPTRSPTCPPTRCATSSKDDQEGQKHEHPRDL